MEGSGKKRKLVVQFESFPRLVLHKIMLLLELKDVYRLMRTCKRLRRIAQEESLWVKWANRDYAKYVEVTFLDPNNTVIELFDKKIDMCRELYLTDKTINKVGLNTIRNYALSADNLATFKAIVLLSPYFRSDMRLDPSFYTNALYSASTIGSYKIVCFILELCDLPDREVLEKALHKSIMCQHVLLVKRLLEHPKIWVRSFHLDLSKKYGENEITKLVENHFNQAK